MVHSLHENHGSCIYHFGVEVFSDLYNYNDSRQAVLLDETDHRDTWRLNR